MILIVNILFACLEMNVSPTLALVKPAEQFGQLVEPEVFFDVTSTLRFRAEVFTFGSSLGIDTVPHLATYHVDETDVADAFLEFNCHHIRI